MNKFPIDPDHNAPLDAIEARVRELDKEAHPDLENVKEVVLREGQRVIKKAVLWSIRDRKTGQHHHRTLKFEIYKRHKKYGVYRDEPDESDTKLTLTLSDENRELTKLFNFLAVDPDLNEQGDYIVIKKKDGNSAQLKKVLDTLSSVERVSLIENLLQLIEKDVEILDVVVGLAVNLPGQSGALAGALNIGRYTEELRRFRNLVDENAEERFYQKFLEKNLWMLGSEYRTLLARRNYTVDEQLDLPLTRTVDNCLEIIELKRPLAKDLFQFDRSRNLYYPGPDLSQVIGQAAKYIRKIEQQRNQIMGDLEPGLEVNKVSAKIIIGRDGNLAQQTALRDLNSHLHRIDVLTYDQLIRTAERVLELLTQDTRRLAAEEKHDSSED